MADMLHTNDNCNAATRAQRMTIERVGGTGQHCMNHIINTVISNPTAKCLKNVVKDEINNLDEVDPILRVGTGHMGFARAFYKCCSFPALYPKGSGKLLAIYVKKTFQGVPLWPTESTHGSRMNIIFTSAPAIYMNRFVVMHFLKYMRDNKPKGERNILQENLLVMLTSHEILGQTRLLVIMLVSIVMPMRCLTAKTHVFGQNLSVEWGAGKIGMVWDTLMKTLLELKNEPAKFCSEIYMMSIFDEFEDMLPEFSEYMHATFRAVQPLLVHRPTGGRIVQFRVLVGEAFHPSNKSNRMTTPIVIKYALPVVIAMITEMENRKTKHLWKYFARNQQPECWPMRKLNDKLMRGLKVVNDPAESALATATRNLEEANCLGKHNAAADGTGRRDGFFVRQSLIDNSKKKRKGSNKTEKRLGYFHQLHPDIQDAIMAIAIASAPATRDANRECVRQQELAKLRKEVGVRDRAIKRASDRFAKQSLYYNMYSTPAYINDQDTVDSVLTDTKFIKDQRKALGNNIKIRVDGFGWEAFKLTYIGTNRFQVNIHRYKAGVGSS